MKSDNLDDGACCVFVIITYLLGLFINGNQWAGQVAILFAAVTFILMLVL